MGTNYYLHEVCAHCGHDKKRHSGHGAGTWDLIPGGFS